MTALADKYMSSGRIKLAANVQPASGASPHWSDAIQQFIAGLGQFEDTLLAWLNDPSALADDETDPPSRETIKRAIDFTQRIQDAVTDRSLTVDTGFPRPRGVSIGTGGSISLEFELGAIGHTVVFEPDGRAESMAFVANRLIRRDSLNA